MPQAYANFGSTNTCHSLFAQSNGNVMLQTPTTAQKQLEIEAQNDKATCRRKPACSISR
jgi:hypothetical protein